MSLALKPHPCQKCGACCAYFRVGFYWWEAETESEYQVPKHLTVDLDFRQRCMKGTEHKHQNRCVALTGKIGEHVSCSIYEHRPTPCRQFKASYENGEQEPRCDQARAKHGLEPLTKYDWPEIRPPPVAVGEVISLPPLGVG